jgi:PAS domain S-box-containing protein
VARSETLTYTRMHEEARVQTILLVEDEAIIALVESKTLEGFGYKIRLARSGEAAVEEACDDSIDLVLMDIDLGSGIDGTEAARRILERRNLPIVFLTSHSERECVERVRGITRYGYVIKDSGSFVLQSSIEMAFELFAAHEKLRAGEHRLSAVIETIPDLVWLKDQNGVFLACNAAFSRYYGATEAEIVGKTDYDFVSADIADFYRGKDREATESGSKRSNEEWIVYPDNGQRSLLETIKTPMFDASGKLVGILGIGRDITERKRIEEALKQSEASVRRKLDAIVAPGGDVGELSLSDIIDVPMLQALMDDFSALTGMATAVLDIDGKILVATGWSDICTKFHRACAESATACTESDLFLAANVKSGEYVEYHCKNNLWDIVTPLYIGERHVGNIYSGQFFYTDDVVDEELFTAQAERFGYDAEAYLEALRRVPRYERSEIVRLMDFLVRLTNFVSKLSYSNLRLAKTTTELKQAKEEKEILLKELQHRTKNSLSIVSSFLRLNMADLDDERSKRVFQEAVDRIKCVAMIYDKLSVSTESSKVELGRYLGDLVELLRSTYSAKSERLRVVTSFEAMDCDIKRAVWVGLILNELFTNAIKYAYAPEESGEIRISLSAAEGSAELRVSDDGPGLPEGLDVENATSLGLRITSLLAADLRGSIAYAPGKGATAVLRF